MSEFVYWWSVIAPWTALAVFAVAFRTLRRVKKIERECEAELRELESETEQIHAINLVLQQCALRSFLYAHLPFWRPWSEFTGVEFTVEVRPRRGKQ